MVDSLFDGIIMFSCQCNSKLHAIFSCHGSEAKEMNNLLLFFYFLNNSNSSKTMSRFASSSSNSSNSSNSISPQQLQNKKNTTISPNLTDSHLPAKLISNEVLKLSFPCINLMAFMRNTSTCTSLTSQCSVHSELKYRFSLTTALKIEVL